jgi:ubiquinone/menaquinone biosynthesis C-methylase UbiE
VLLSNSFQDHFSGVAVDYALFRPIYPDALFDHMASLCPEQSLAWDCGAGSGQASAALAQRFRRVLASDLSQSQIARASRLPNVCYHLAPAETAAIPTGVVDLVTVAQALHWFSRREFFEEVRRVLKPRGVIAAWCYTLMSIDEALDPVIHGFYHDIVGPYWPLSRELVEDAYRSVEFPFTEIAAPGFEMTEDWTLEQLLGYLGTWSAVRRYREREGIDPRELIRAPLSEAWHTAGGSKRVRWPLHVRLGRVS